MRAGWRVSAVVSLYSVSLQTNILLCDNMKIHNRRSWACHCYVFSRLVETDNCGWLLRFRIMQFRTSTAREQVKRNGDAATNRRTTPPPETTLDERRLNFSTIPPEFHCYHVDTDKFSEVIYAQLIEHNQERTTYLHPWREKIDNCSIQNRLLSRYLVLLSIPRSLHFASAACEQSGGQPACSVTIVHHCGSRKPAPLAARSRLAVRTWKQTSTGFGRSLSGEHLVQNNKRILSTQSAISSDSAKIKQHPIFFFQFEI